LGNHSSHYTPGGLENNKQLTGSFSRQLSILSQAERAREREREVEGTMFTQQYYINQDKMISNTPHYALVRD